MKISIFGLGYVGCVSMAALAHSGHKVIGLDVNPVKVSLIQQGKSPIIEKDLEKYIQTGLKNKRIEATQDVDYAIKNTDISLICVGTPSKKDGALDLKYTIEVCKQIAKALKNKKARHIVAFKSTMLPGSAETVLAPVLEKYSGLKVGKGLQICSNPEFLRESTAISDFFNPPSTIVGASDQNVAKTLMRIYNKVKGPKVITSIKIAEMIKYTDNVFHGLKIAFSNEIGTISKRLGVDGREVMKIFCLDTKLNLSPYYLKPGFPFGGSCLPKDIRGLNSEAKMLDLSLPILSSIIPSNERQINECVHLIEKQKKKNIGILGVSFKSDTDDVRESPILKIIEILEKKGYKLKVYDKNVLTTQKFGVNKQTLEKELPHIFKMFDANLHDIIKRADVLVVENGDKEFLSAEKYLTKDKILIDFVGLFKDKRLKCKYVGLCW